MSFFAVLFALLIEQARPLRRGGWVSRNLVLWAIGVARNFDAGRPHHAWVAWSITVVLPSLFVALAYISVAHYSLLLALALDVAVLYLALGFRQFSHYFSAIRDALERGDEFEARRLLSEWRKLDASELPRSEILRQVVEHSLVAAHRHVFGVFFWFVLLSAVGLGPAGAVAYRLADFASRHFTWGLAAQDAGVHDRLAAVARSAFRLMDHIPIRLTAFGFAVVGNFEEAVNSWRRDAGLWPQPNEGVLLSAAAGALGVALGGAAPPSDTEPAQGTASTAGAVLQMGHLQTVVGLVWRSVVLWMLLVALLTLSNVLG
jgi:adenosylcobinamide-phosphate synthase